MSRRRRSRVAKGNGLEFDSGSESDAYHGDFNVEEIGDFEKRA
jgi:hypothetical protein